MLKPTGKLLTLVASVIVILMCGKVAYGCSYVIDPQYQGADPAGESDFFDWVLVYGIFFLLLLNLSWRVFLSKRYLLGILVLILLIPAQFALLYDSLLYGGTCGFLFLPVQTIRVEFATLLLLFITQVAHFGISRYRARQYP